MHEYMRFVFKYCEIQGIEVLVGGVMNDVSLFCVESEGTVFVKNEVCNSFRGVI